MRSKLYTGRLRHRRSGPRTYQFQYGVFYLYIDLDEIAGIDRRLRLLSYNRLNVLSFLDRDHTGANGQGVRAAVRERLVAHGIDLDGCSVGLLTNPRIVNYVFNPVSFYLIRDATGRLRHVLAEVHNTHGQRHVYDLDRLPGEGAYRARATKQFYVSPFIDMEGRYEFSCTDGPAGALDIRLDEFQDGTEPFFQAQIEVAPQALTNRNVARVLARYPLMTLRTVALIHWQGLKLWLRGEPFRANPRKGDVIR